MIKKLLIVTIMLMLGVCARQTLAMGSVKEVTKENQIKLELNFTIIAERVSDDVVLVSMEIPRKGKLKRVRSVSLSIGGGVLSLAATLETSTGKNGARAVAFQLSNELANKCRIHLIVPDGLRVSRTYGIYAIELKGYVKDRK